MTPLAELVRESYLPDATSLVVCLFGLGLIVGVLTGLFGVGGGFLITPVLHVVFGFNYSLAVGSDLAAIAGSSSVGLMRHRKFGNVEPTTIFLIAVGSVPGSILGAWGHHYLHGLLGDEFKTLMSCLFIVILLLTAWLVWRDPKPEARRRPLLQRLRLGPHVDLSRIRLSHVSLPGLTVVGLGVGVLIGLLGVGGGVLFVPILLLAVGMSAHQAVGTSLGVVLCSSIVACLTHASRGGGNVSLWISLSILTGSATGVQIGAWICSILHARRLRRYFALLVLAAAAMLVVKVLWPASGGQ